MFVIDGQQATDNCNRAKDVFLGGLLRDGKITEEQYADFSRYALIVGKRSWLGSLIAKLAGGDDSETTITCARVV